MKNERRVERHVLKPSQAGYDLILQFCHASKNLYNHANYLVRQSFIKENLWLRYGTLDRLLKQDHEYPDYKRMPTAQSAQQTLKMLDANWKSFFVAVKDWKKNPEKYLEKPKIPGYQKKDKCYPLALTNQECRVKDGILVFPKSFDGFTISQVFTSNERFLSFQQVRFIPHVGRIVIELVYTVSVPEEKPDNGRYIGIDIGVDNLAAVANTWGDRPFLLNGRPLKSMNQYANKEKAHYQSLLERVNGQKSSNRIRSLMGKRTRKLDDYLHKASRYIIDYCIRNHVSKIIIGKNDGWKQESSLSKRVNQNFVQIPFARFIGMLQYKAKENGIAVILTEESYTSGTSFLDGEEPVKEFYNRKRRVKRGLFLSNTGQYINADINGAFQIIRKVIPMKWDRGCVLHPILITVA